MIAAGIAFGTLLFLLALGAADGGHGTYLLFGVFGAPLSVAPFLGMLIAPIWWGFVGYYLRRRSRHSVTMLVVHTVGAGLILWLGTPMEPGSSQWEYYSRMDRLDPLWMRGSLAFYIAGLVFAWFKAVRIVRGEQAFRMHTDQPY